MKNSRRILAFMLVFAMLFADGSMAALADVILTMPTALSIVDVEAFYGATGIDKVVLSDNTTEIRARAFANSTVSEINFPEALTFIAEDAFEGTKYVNFTTQPGTYAEDWVNHFYSGVCGNEVQWCIDANGLLTISGSGAMYNWESSQQTPWAYSGRTIQDVNVESSVSSVGSYAFVNCQSVNRVVLSEGIQEINSYAFAFSSVKSILLPRSLSYIASSAFLNTKVTAQVYASSEAHLFCEKYNIPYEIIHEWDADLQGSVESVNRLIHLHSSEDWTISCSSTWISFDKKVGEAGEHFIGMTLAPNTATSARSATVTIKNNVDTAITLVIEQAAPVKPGKPTNVQVTEIDGNTVQISWNLSEQVSEYQIYSATTSTGTGTFVTSVDKETNSCMITDVVAGKKVYYYVSAVSCTGHSANSSRVSCQTMAITPGVPTNIVAEELSYDAVRLSWDAADDTNEYHIYTQSSSTFSSTSAVLQTVTEDLSCMVTGLTAGKSVYYFVVACSSTGTEGAKTAKLQFATQKITPAAIANLSVTVTQPTQVRLDWEECEGAVGYHIYFASSSTKPSEPACEVQTTSCTISELTTNKLYYFWVCPYSATETDGTAKSISKTVRIKPEVPENLQAKEIDAESITVTWESVPNAEKYFVYLTKSYISTSYTKVGETLENEYTISGLDAGTKYLIKVSGYSSTQTEGEKTSSLECTTAHIIPGAINNLQVVGTTSNGVFLYWDEDENSVEYRITIETREDFENYGLWEYESPFEIEDLLPNTRYRFWVNGYSSSRKDGESSVTEWVYTQDGPMPPAMEGIVLSASSKKLWLDNSFTLKASMYPENTIKQSIVWSSSDKTVATVSSNGYVSAKGEGTAIITASTKDGSFSATCVVTVKDFDSDVEGPEPPSEVTVSATSTNSIKLTWSQDSYAEASQICYGVRGSTNQTTITSVRPYYEITGLLPNTEYEFSLRSVSARGVFSEYSSKVYARTVNGSSITVTGSFGEKTVDVVLGESITLNGSLSCAGGTIGRVSIRCPQNSSWELTKNYTSYKKNQLFLQDDTAFVINTTVSPFNIPGSYSLNLFAEDSSNAGEHLLSTMIVNVIPPNSEINGSFVENYVEVTLGDTCTLKGNVSVSLGTLGRVTVNSHILENSAMTKDFSDYGVTSICLQDWTEIYSIDTTKEPYNIPGAYPINMYAKDSNGNGGSLLASMTLVIKENVVQNNEPCINYAFIEGRNYTWVSPESGRHITVECNDQVDEIDLFDGENRVPFRSTKNENGVFELYLLEPVPVGMHTYTISAINIESEKISSPYTLVFCSVQPLTEAESFVVYPKQDVITLWSSPHKGTKRGNAYGAKIPEELMVIGDTPGWYHVRTKDKKEVFVNKNDVGARTIDGINSVVNLSVEIDETSVMFYWNYNITGSLRLDRGDEEGNYNTSLCWISGFSHTFNREQLPDGLYEVRLYYNTSDAVVKASESIIIQVGTKPQHVCIDYVYYDDQLVEHIYCAICNPRSADQLMHDAENFRRMVLAQSANASALSLTDGASVVLESMSENSNSIWKKGAWFAINAASFKWGDIATDTWKTTTEVAKLKKQAIADAVVTYMNSTYDASDANKVGDSTLFLALLSFADATEKVEDLLKIGPDIWAKDGWLNSMKSVLEMSHLSAEDMWVAVTFAVKDYTFEEKRLAELAKKLQDTGKTTSFDWSNFLSVGTILLNTGFDFIEYSHFSSSQRKLFDSGVCQATHMIQVLEELKRLNSNDKELVWYCNTAIREIQGSANWGTLKNTSISLAQDIVGEGIDKAMSSVTSIFLGKTCGAVLSVVGGITGWVVDCFAGVNEKMECYNQGKALYSSIAQNVASHNLNVNNKKIGSDARAIHKMYIMYLKIAGLNLSKKVVDKNTKTSIEDMIDSYSNKLMYLLN